MQAMECEVLRGSEGVKLGWFRVNFNYFVSDVVRDYLVCPVPLENRHGHRLLPDYRFDPHSGLWHHRFAAAAPPVRLSDVSYDSQGVMHWPHRRTILGEDALPEHLRDAAQLLAARPDRIDTGPTGLPDDFEALRWFHLPPQ